MDKPICAATPWSSTTPFHGKGEDMSKVVQDHLIHRGLRREPSRVFPIDGPDPALPASSRRRRRAGRWAPPVKRARVAYVNLGQTLAYGGKSRTRRRLARPRPFLGRGGRAAQGGDVLVALVPLRALIRAFLPTSLARRAAKLTCCKRWRPAHAASRLHERGLRRGRWPIRATSCS